MTYSPLNGNFGAVFCLGWLKLISGQNQGVWKVVIFVLTSAAAAGPFFSPTLKTTHIQNRISSCDHLFDLFITIYHLLKLPAAISLSCTLCFNLPHMSALTRLTADLCCQHNTCWTSSRAIWHSWPSVGRIWGLPACLHKGRWRFPGIEPGFFLLAW